MTRRRLLAWGAAAGWMAVIFTVSSLSFNAPIFQSVEQNHIDVLAHMGEYTVLGFLLAEALGTSVNPRARWFFPAAFLLGVLYGLSDEIHQSFVPFRDPSVFDWMADAFGTAAGILLWKKKRFSRHA